MAASQSMGPGKNEEVGRHEEAGRRGEESVKHAKEVGKHGEESVRHEEEVGRRGETETPAGSYVAGHENPRHQPGRRQQRTGI